MFALALILAGFSSLVTASMSSASIFSGIFGEPMDLSDNHSRTGVIITLLVALAAVFVTSDPFKGLIWSQVVLSLQLPLTVFGLIALTSSRKVMGAHANNLRENAVLVCTGAVVTMLNAALVISMFRGV